MIKYVSTIILCGLSAYGGSFAAIKHFDNTHSVIIIQKADGDYLARDKDSERAQKDWMAKK